MFHEMVGEHRKFHFDPFTIETNGYVIRRNGRRIKGPQGKALMPKAVEILIFLIDNQDHIVRAEDLKGLLGQAQSEDQRHSALVKYMSYLRSCLGSTFDDYVKNFSKKREPEHKGGYRFVGSVRVEDIHGGKHRPREIIPVSRAKRHFFYCHRMPLLSGRFEGRHNEKKLITDAYQGQNIRVVSFYAPFGGEGKSQLVLDWLKQQHANRDPAPIFCFSFSGQETPGEERASGADFFEKAFEKFEVQIPAQLTFDKKAAVLAQVIREAGAILCLDGVEALQEPIRNAEPPRLTDGALANLLSHLSSSGAHFCLITTRYRIADLERHPNVQQVELRGLDLSACVRLLRSYGLSGGDDDELRKVAEEWGCHALSLNLLGSYLAEYCQGDIRRRDTLRLFNGSGALPSVQDSVRLMLDAHEQKLHGTHDLQLLRVLSLLDRPEQDEALRKLVLRLISPPIKDLSGQLDSLRPLQFNAALKHLEDLNLIVKVGSGFLLRQYSCHPLIQQHQRERLRTSFRTAWIAGHKRLFHYFRALPHARIPDTPEDINTLYRAVAHGCAAGLHSSAFSNVYWPRISRGDEHFTSDQKGFVSGDLAGLRNFFDHPWSDPVQLLPPRLRAKVLSLAGFRLRTLGRLDDAKIAIERALLGFERLKWWADASEEANNLAVLLRMQGRLREAIAEAKKGLAYSRRVRKPRIKIRRMGALGELLHYSWRLEEALSLFKNAARMQAKSDRQHPNLNSTIGFRYCELLLTLGQFDRVKQLAKAIPVLGTSKNAILNKGLAYLCEGRAFMEVGKRGNRTMLAVAEEHLRHSYLLMRDSQHRDNQIRACVALSECLRLQKKYVEAAELVEEACRIAELSGMRFHKLDCEFERLQIKLVGASPKEVRLELDELEKRAHNMQYELLRRKILRLISSSAELQ